ncbi:MAG: glycosyltransferase [Planctomycetes bacterium]|nr:glycosyltransferase [Planctomycetota bacterium]
MRRHILQLLPEVDPGGAERVVLMLARHLPRERFDVSVAALDGRGALGAALREAGCPVYDLGGRGCYSVGSLPAFCRLVRTVRPDIVHSHLFRAHLAAAWSGCRKHTRAVVMTEHQADPRRWAMWLLRRAARRADALTAVSEGVRSHLIARGFSPESVLMLPNGIETQPLAEAQPACRATLSLPDDARMLLFAGRLTRQKGLDVLLAALSSLAADYPSLRLVVAGDGEDRPALTALAARLGLAQRVVFLGRRDDVPSLMKAADVVVLPSRWEGLSLVLLEAMAAGRPVVATRVEGQTETIDHGRTGLLVESESPEAMAAAICRVLDDTALAARMSEAAAAQVLQHFTATAMASRYADLYDRLLTDRAGADLC